MSNSVRDNSNMKVIKNVVSSGLKKLYELLTARPAFGIAIVTSFLAMLYWGIVASDRYVSEAHIVIQKTDIASSESLDFSSLLGGVGKGGETEQLLLRAYLLSVDMLNTLDAELNLRDHYSDRRRDILSRLWDSKVPLEMFYQYYQERVEVVYDSYSGVLVIRAQGYTPEMAHAITTTLVSAGEQYMNELAHRLAGEQVHFLENQVESMSARAFKARKSVLDYQNKMGVVAPEGFVENLSGIINGLETKLTELQTRKQTMLGFMSRDSSKVVEVNQQIEATKKQLKYENKRLASPDGESLNKSVEEYQRLKMDAEFTQSVLSTALLALEKGRIEATRTLKKVSIIQSPTVPQYPMMPRRIYNITVFILMALLLAGVAHLLAAIVRDHTE